MRVGSFMFFMFCSLAQTFGNEFVTGPKLIVPDMIWYIRGTYHHDGRGERIGELNKY